MAFDIAQFREKFRGDGARPNLFYVTINNKTNFWAGSSGFEFFCRASQIPGMTQGVVPVNYMGRQVKFAGNKTYADWTVTVINDENYVYRAQFENWMNQINGARTNIRAGNGTSLEYVADVVVNQLSKQGGDPGTNFVRSYVLKSTFPTDISPITLDWGDNDTIEEFTVSFSFDYFTAANGPGEVTPADTVDAPGFA
tara:strand:- start:64 stop:654 length:591 start_codon:yes stop_codon:yes gene_type:complete